VITAKKKNFTRWTCLRRFFPFRNTLVFRSKIAYNVSRVSKEKLAGRILSEKILTFSLAPKTILGIYILSGAQNALLSQ